MNHIFARHTMCIFLQDIQCVYFCKIYNAKISKIEFLIEIHKKIDVSFFETFQSKDEDATLCIKSKTFKGEKIKTHFEACTHV